MKKMFSFQEACLYLIWALGIETLIGVMVKFDLTAWQYTMTGLLAGFNILAIVLPIFEWFKADKKKDLIVEEKPKKKKVSK